MPSPSANITVNTAATASGGRAGPNPGTGLLMRLG